MHLTKRLTIQKLLYKQDYSLSQKRYKVHKIDTTQSQEKKKKKKEVRSDLLSVELRLRWILGRTANTQLAEGGVGESVGL